jgi:hypothetical protein
LKPKAAAFVNFKAAQARDISYMYKCTDRYANQMLDYTREERESQVKDKHSNKKPRPFYIRDK